MPVLSDARTLVPSGVEVTPGWAQSIAVVDPAPGVVSVARQIQGDFWERLWLARATFTTDATVGTRNPRLEIVGGDGLIYYGVPISLDMVASTTVRVSFAIDGPSSLVAAGLSVQRMPNILLQSGWTVRFVADGVGAADSWTGVRFYVIRYPTDIVNAGAGG